MTWRMVVARRTADPFPVQVGDLDFAYRQWEYDAAVYLPPMVAQVVGWWQRNAVQWWPHRLGLWLGVLTIKEGDYYRNARFCLPWRAR